MDLREIRKFVWKHRYQLGGALIAIAATVSIVSFLIPRNDDDRLLNDKDDNETGSNSSNDSTARKLVTIRHQFDTCSSQIFPTLRIKITEIVDVLQTIKQIKELRMNSDNHQRSIDIENSLWEEIKVLSFTLWLTSIYATAATCILLRAQLFLLSRRENELIKMNRQDFEKLINDTYSNLFEKGIIDFVDTLRTFIVKSLADCTVKDKVSYQYDEFNLFIMKVRYFVEQETQDMVMSLILPHGEKAVEDNKKYDASFVDRHRAELWDIIESPMFNVALKEAIDVCFKRHMELLRQDVFSIMPGGSITSKVGNFSSPPLASLLPQLKSLASSLLPLEGVGYEISEIYAGPAIDSLCVSIMDSK